MKLYLPILASVLTLASCSTAYKTGQTPDDVYYSPARQRDEYVRVEKEDDRQYRNDEAYREDRYLRMKTAYRRYSVLTDYDCYSYNGSNYYGYYDYYRNNNFGYSNNWYVTPKYYGSFYNPYYYNPYYNSPYYSGVVAGNVQRIYNGPRTTNLNTYTNSNGNTSTNYSKTRSYSTAPANSNDNYRNSGTNAGGFLRNAFGSGNSNSSSSSTPSSSPSSSSSSSSSSSGSSSAPVRKF